MELCFIGVDCRTGDLPPSPVISPGDPSKEVDGEWMNEEW